MCQCRHAIRLMLMKGKARMPGRSGTDACSGDRMCSATTGQEPLQKYDCQADCHFATVGIGAPCVDFLLSRHQSEVLPALQAHAECHAGSCTKSEPNLSLQGLVHLGQSALDTPANASLAPAAECVHHLFPYQCPLIWKSACNEVLINMSRF